jgi:formylglycine-generating enzyme required for sulfatase activity
VGSYPANAWKLRDMHGNVSEWVEDCWNGNYEGAPGNGGPWLGKNDGDCSARVVRGGSWFSVAGSARSAARDYGVPVNRYDIVGLRVLCASPIE